MPIRTSLKIDASDLKKTLRGEVVEEAKASASAMSNAFTRKAKEMGGKTAKEITKGLREELKARKAVLRDQLAEGLIDRKAFRRQVNGLKSDFNSGIKTAIEGMKKEGRLTREEYTRLAGSLKTVSRAGKDAGSAGERGASRWRRGLERVRSSLFSLKGLVAGVSAFFLARTVGRFFSSSIQVAEEASAVWSRLESNIENAGTRFSEVQGEIQSVAREIQNTTRFGDEDTAEALAELVGLTGNYREAMANLGLVLDFAVSKNRDLRTSAQVVGRTLLGDTSLLKRYGIIVQEGADAIEVMRAQMEGAATDEGSKLSGRLRRLRNEWADIKQAVGDVLLGNESASETVNQLSDALVRLEGWIRTNASQLNTFASAAINAAGGAGRFLEVIFDRLDPAGAVAREEIARAMTLSTPDALASRRRELGMRIQGISGPGGMGGELGEQRSRARLLRGPAQRAAQRRVAELEDELEGLQAAVEWINAQEERLLAEAGGGAGGGTGRRAPRSISERTPTGGFAVPGISVRALESLQANGLQAADVLDQLRAEVDALTAAEVRLEQARLEADPEAEAAATLEVADAKEALRAKVQEVAVVLGELIKDEEALAGLQVVLREALAETGEELEDQKDDWEDMAETISGVARGVLSVADAMGVLDDQTRRVLQGVVDVADGFAAFSSGNTIGGLAQMVGGAIGFFGGLFSGREQSEEAKRIQRALEENRRALERNTAALEGQLAGGDPTVGRARAALKVAADALRNAEDDPETGRSTFTSSDFFDLLDAELEARGLSREDLQALAESFGIELVGLGAYLDLLEKLGDVTSADVANSFAGAMELLRREFELLEGLSPEEKLRRVRDTLADFVGGDLERRLRAVDFSDPAAVAAFMEAILSEVRGGTFPLEDLEGVTLEEFLDTLEELKDLAAGGGGGDVSRSVQIARSITEIQAVEVIAWLQDIAFTARDLLEEVRALRGTGAAVGFNLGRAMRPGPDPIPFPGAAAGVQIGALHINAEPDFREAWRRLGEELILKSKGRLR